MKHFLIDVLIVNLNKLKGNVAIVLLLKSYKGVVKKLIVENFLV